MGQPIEPNLNCPAPHIILSEWTGSEETCKAYCNTFCAGEAYSLDCLEGPGVCFYSFFICFCEPYPEQWWKVYCFYTYDSDSCEEPGGYTPHHDNDIPRILLFDYGMCWIPGTKYELYSIPDSQDKVIAFRNPKVPMNLKIKFDVEYFLP